MPLIHRRVRLTAAAAALLALGLAASPAAAERVRSRLGVRATVLSACIVTTTRDDSSAPAATCTQGERPAPAAKTAPPPQPPLAAGAESPSSGGIKMVTLTY